MIKVNSSVCIKQLYDLKQQDVIKHLPPIMIVDGLYSKVVLDMIDIELPKNHVRGSGDVKVAKCLWYNTKNELQSEYIRLELLAEV